LQAKSRVSAKCKEADQGYCFLISSGHEHMLAKSFSADFGNNSFTASAAAFLSRAYSKIKLEI